jgi:lycopene beta-cyclase
VVLAPSGVIEARIVIDAAGWPSRFAPEAARRARTVQPAWQTAIGVVLPEPPEGDLGTATLMDFRPAPGGASDRSSTIGPSGVTSFAYSLPVVDGWLVEETVLAGRPAVEPVALLARLAARLGRHPDDLLASAVRSEFVRIPMGAPLPAPGQPVVVFGAAAGYIHPATGYSIAASLRAAPRVAASIANACSSTTGVATVDAAPVWEAVWPTALRRTRVLHDFGLDTLTRLDGDGTREFFDTFFDLPVDQWSAYLRIDTPPAETAQVMTRLFTGSSWRLRRRLAATNPMAFARLVRP